MEALDPNDGQSLGALSPLRAYLWGQYAHALHLVEHREVCGVDGVTAVNIASHKECALALAQDLCLQRKSDASSAQ
jgi:hypothetical protein